MLGRQKISFASAKREMQHTEPTVAGIRSFQYVLVEIRNFAVILRQQLKGLMIILVAWEIENDTI